MECGRRLSSEMTWVSVCGFIVPRSSASLRPSRYMTATWVTNVLVAATPTSSPARVAHRGQRVGGLAGLRDADDQVGRPDERTAIAVLGGDRHGDRDLRPLLD